MGNDDRAEETVTIGVIPVVCEKCRSKNFKFWRRATDEGNYILQCVDCNHFIEFRVLTSWVADAETVRKIGQEPQ